MIMIELDRSVELKAGDRVTIAGTGIEITFISASTATMDNDDVITDSDFFISNCGIELSVSLESTNGEEASVTVNGYVVIIEYANGYSQTCGLKIIREQVLTFLSDTNAIQP